MSVDAVEFVRKLGIVLESAKGPVPNLAQAVAKTPIRGNWWIHPDSKEIFRATRTARSCESILVCRLIQGKITYIDKSLWPAVVRLEMYFDKRSLASIREEHTATGAHRVAELPFPGWVPQRVRKSALDLSEAEAAAQLGPWATALIQGFQRHPRSRLSGFP